MATNMWLYDSDKHVHSAFSCTVLWGEGEHVFHDFAECRFGNLFVAIVCPPTLQVEEDERGARHKGG